jgi:hypothetical protein
LSRRQAASALRTWVVFPVLHAAYASGFIRGACEAGLPKERHLSPARETARGR